MVLIWYHPRMSTTEFDSLCDLESLGVYDQPEPTVTWIVLPDGECIDVAVAVELPEEIFALGEEIELDPSVPPMYPAGGTPEEAL